MGKSLEDYYFMSVNATSAPVPVKPVVILILVVTASVSLQIVRIGLVPSLDLSEGQKHYNSTYDQPLQQPLRFGVTIRACVA